MKNFLTKLYYSMCQRCFGRGYIELPSGDTLECKVCKGKGGK